MTVTNPDVALVFGRIAGLLELQQAKRFRIRGDRNAAHLLQGLREPVAAMPARGEDLAGCPASAAWRPTPHAADQFGLLDCGVGQARHAWPALRELLSRTM